MLRVAITFVHTLILLEINQVALALHSACAHQ